MSETQFIVSTQGSSTSLHDHNYYGPLIDSYVKSILKSGLLLDEDLEVLLSISKFRNFPERSGYRPSLSLLASGISVLTSQFLAKKLKMPLLVIPSAIATGYFIISEYKNEKRKQDNKKAVDTLIEIINKIQKLKKNIIRYMKTRNDLGKKEQNLLATYNKNLEEFMTTFLQNNFSTIQFLIDHLKELTTYSSELREDFIILEHINVSEILRDAKLSDAENCFQYSQKIYDINILIFSKLLSYIGILFNSQTLRENNIKELLNETWPELIKTLQQYHDVTKKQFIGLRHAMNKRSEIKLENEASKRKNISKKLEATLISSVNNLSVILEKSQNILDRLEEGTDNELPRISNALVDLRNHTFATYESLDLLCRLYEILSNSNTIQSTNTLKVTPKESTMPSESLPTVSYDDNTVPVEEKFELYIGVEEHADDNLVTEYEDQSSAYLSLMLQELRQSLKQHERFIEAKSKREDDDEEIEKINKRHSRREKESPPRFNLNELGDNSDETSATRIPDLLGSDDATVVLPNLPAPPPPPLPSFTLNNLEQETGQLNARSMLDNIKILSSQRNVEEEVFGDSDAESDSST